MALESTRYLRTLRRLMDHHFNLEEIRLICFDLGIDYEHLSGEGKRGKINELLLNLARNGRLADLQTLLQEERPDTEWPDIPPAEQQVQDERASIPDAAREAALQEYLDKMTSLLVEKNLRQSTSDSPLRASARAYTEALLSRLDKSRRAVAVKFMAQSRLFGDDPIVSLAKIDLSETNLSKIDLSGADLVGAELSGATLIDAILVAADLRFARLNGAKLFHADLRDAWLAAAHMNEVDLSQGNLEWANLAYADLRRAKFTLANLENAKLIGATLDEADFMSANLQGANLEESDLSGAYVTADQLAQASSLEDAILPSGRQYDPFIPLDEQLEL